MQRLDPAAMNGDVQQTAEDVAVLRQAAMEAGGGQLQAAQQLLQLSWPLLHQAVDIRHGAAVLDAGRRFGAVKGTNALHPAVHCPRVGLGTRDTRHLLQLEDGRTKTDRETVVTLLNLPQHLITILCTNVSRSLCVNSD